jgi:S-formylglutathione hydrolase FrmB
LTPIEGTWSEVQVAGHICDIYEPARRSEQPGAVMYLHGVHLARLAENEVFSRELERHGLPLVAPRTARSWWTDKICPEFDAQISAERYVLEHVVPYVQERWNVSPPLVALLGTSMGGQGALRLAFRHPRTFPISAALAPAIDYQMRFNQPDEETLPQMYPDAESARQDTATLHVHPLNWPRHTWFCCDPVDHRWQDSAQKLRMKLSALGIMHECDLETSAGGHSWHYYNHMAPRALAFIAERLERERCRVV